MYCAKKRSCLCFDFTWHQKQDFLHLMRAATRQIDCFWRLTSNQSGNTIYNIFLVSKLYLMILTERLSQCTDDDDEADKNIQSELNEQ